MWIVYFVLINSSLKFKSVYLRKCLLLLSILPDEKSENTIDRATECYTDMYTKTYHIMFWFLAKFYVADGSLAKNSRDWKEKWLRMTWNDWKNSHLTENWLGKLSNPGKTTILHLHVVQCACASSSISICTELKIFHSIALFTCMRCIYSICFHFISCVFRKDDLLFLHNHTISR